MSASATKLLQSLELAVGKQGKHRLIEDYKLPTTHSNIWTVCYTMDARCNLLLRMCEGRNAGQLIHLEHSAML